MWDQTEIAEERSPDGATVQKRFYVQGSVDNDGTNLYYTKDHLGSIRELTDSTQAVRARYDYDPYGRMTKVSGDRDSTFGYTGHFWHGQSGLNLTWFRAYDPNLGRWISRDPIGVDGGINVYQYVSGNPINLVDIKGLESEAECIYNAWLRMDKDFRAMWNNYINTIRNIDEHYDEAIDELRKSFEFSISDLYGALRALSSDAIKWALAADVILGVIEGLIVQLGLKMGWLQGQENAEKQTAADFYVWGKMERRKQYEREVEACKKKKCKGA